MLCCTSCRTGVSWQQPGTDSRKLAQKAPEAAFPYHMFAFHSGTMLQSNPDPGDPGTSDGSLDSSFRCYQGGKFVEVRADRVTRQFVPRGEISFLIQVKGDAPSAMATAVFYDLQGRRVRGASSTTLEGRRVVRKYGRACAGFDVGNRKQPT